MLGDEATIENITLYTKKRYKPIKKAFRRYFFAICVLFAVVVVLCINNFVIYRSYINTKVQFNTAFQKVKAIMTDKSDLNATKDSLTKENNDLKESFKTFATQNQEILAQMEEIKKKNNELIKKNNELIDDNIALQNSLKMAAAVGIKPQNFTAFGGLTTRGNLERGKYVGKFLGTSYTPSKSECGNNKGITNSGKPIIPGISIAIDSKYWPFGTVFYIKGLGYAVAMDTGSAIKGKNRFDFAVFDKDFAQMLGVRYWEVYLVRMGNGNMDDVIL